MAGSQITHTVSTTQPTIANIGDEWYDSVNNKLYKNISYSATTPQWIELFSTITTSASANIGNLTVTGTLAIGATGSLNATTLSQTINMTMPGTITAPVIGSARYYPTRTISLTAVNANLGVAPSGNFVFQILKNSLSIGYNFTITAQNPQMTVIYLSGISLSISDFLTVNILNGSAVGQDLAVKISYN